MIVRSKDILNNKYRISGTRISVETIVSALYSDGIDWILDNYSSITIEDIIDCLDFYIKHRLGDMKDENK